MTEREIQVALYWRHQGSCQVVMPNWTPPNWHECDIFVVTDAGYWHEYEIKLTKADYKADTTKGYPTGFVDGKFGPTPERMKHARLASNRGGPTTFTFVMPKDLIPLGDIPEWAGLIYASGRTGGTPHLMVIRKAPRRHKEKIGDGYAADCLRKCYHRYWNALDDVGRLLRQLAESPA